MAILTFPDAIHCADETDDAHLEMWLRISRLEVSYVRACLERKLRGSLDTFLRVSDAGLRIADKIDLLFLRTVVFAGVKQ